MSELITYSEAAKQTKLSRSTISKRLKKLGQKPTKMKTPGAGHPFSVLTQEQLRDIVSLTPEKYRDLMIDKKMEQIKSTPKNDSMQIASSSTGISKNRENGYYMTIQPYERMNGFNAIGVNNEKYQP